MTDEEIIRTALRDSSNWHDRCKTTCDTFHDEDGSRRALDRATSCESALVALDRITSPLELVVSDQLDDAEFFSYADGTYRLGMYFRVPLTTIRETFVKTYGESHVSDMTRDVNGRLSFKTTKHAVLRETREEG